MKIQPKTKGPYKASLPASSDCKWWFYVWIGVNDDTVWLKIASADTAEAAQAEGERLLGEALERLATGAQEALAAWRAR